MAPHSSVLAWRIPGTGSLVGCRLWGRTESDTTETMQQQQQQQQQHQSCSAGQSPKLQREENNTQHAKRCEIKENNPLYLSLSINHIIKL